MKEKLADKKLLCFVSASAEALDGKGKFALDQIDPFLCNTVAYFDPDNLILTDDLQFKYANETIGQSKNF